MREMTENEQLMFDIIKNHKGYSNYNLVREFYFERYGINLPDLKGMEEYGTVERMVRLLKSLYPSELTDEEERKARHDAEDKFKEMALDRNKPIKPLKQDENEPSEKTEQLGLGIFGEINWW